MLYNPISRHYQETFGCKVYKLPVVTQKDCPNRRGYKGMQVCIFCDPWGSSAHNWTHFADLTTQIQKLKLMIQKARKAQKFLVYFQAYTHSLAGLRMLEKQYETALQDPDVVGIVVGTRPDCLSPALMELWKDVSQQTYFAIELGIQSFQDSHLSWLKRGHTRAQSIKAIEWLTSRGLLTGIHLIFGLPEETDDHLKQTAKLCHELNVHNVKLHNLVVLKQTELAQLWQQGQFQPVDLPEYARKVGIFLGYLHPKIYVQRLAALAASHHELLAPTWAANKMKTHQFIIDYLKAQGLYQGQALGLEACQVLTSPT